MQQNLIVEGEITVDLNTLLLRLNWFYTLENEQVRFYLTKAKQSEDSYDERMLLYASDVEAGHVRNIAEWIYRFGGQPTDLGEELGKLFGTVVGKLDGLTGIDRMFAVSIFLEERAMSDYRAMIREVDNWELTQTLWNNLIEEDLHCSWFKIRQEQLRAQAVQTK